MQITTVKRYTTRAILEDITLYSFTAKSGKEANIVTLHTDDGKYTGNLSTWRNQHIQESELHPGTPLDITYTLYHKGDRTFRNFQGVQVAR